MTTEASSYNRSSRFPGFLHLAFSAVLVLILASLTVTAAQTPPPAIAEFAPDAVKQIKDAPADQASDVGSGAGGSATGTRASAKPSASAIATVGPRALASKASLPEPPQSRVRRCVGNPPRQTEDPQSPPCVAFWEGDNGGDTAKGIVGGQIRINLSHVSQRVADVLQAYFNDRYEFYGRKLRLDLTNPALGTCDQNRAAADQIADEVKVFASGNKAGTDTTCYFSELARKHVIVATTLTGYDEPQMASFDPYLWEYQMANDRMFKLQGEQLCARFAGKNATYSSDAKLKASKRVFGAILQYESGRDSPVSIDGLKRGLAQCGEKLGAFVDYAGALDPATAQQAILKMQAAKVTTVVCLCLAFVEQNLPPAADNQSYYPEWMFSTYGANDTNLALKTFWPDPTQRTALFGMTVKPRQTLLADEAWWRAAKEADPTFGETDIGELEQGYHALLLLASGIQMAGPHLTPKSFAAALHTTRFPNPVTPLNAGNVGFLDGDHSMTDDAAEFFWRETARDPAPTSTTVTGALCYLDHGVRRQPGRWPRGEGGYFGPSCDSGV